MKSLSQLKEKLRINNRGVFGLTSVQQFFAIILGVALLAYVIIVIMGTLQNSTLLPSSTVAGKTTNESGSVTEAGYTLAQSTALSGFTSPAIVEIWNATGNLKLSPLNYTLVGNVVYNTTEYTWASVKITYTYNYNTQVKNNADSILDNTSIGVTNFFGAINPVYAILAILVIILVLVVLVRVVTGGEGYGRSAAAGPQL